MSWLCVTCNNFTKSFLSLSKYILMMSSFKLLSFCPSFFIIFRRLTLESNQGGKFPGGKFDLFTII